MKFAESELNALFAKYFSFHLKSQICPQLNFLKNYIHKQSFAQKIISILEKADTLTAAQHYKTCFKPTCHYDQGTCREPDWALTHCMKPHYVYLANTSGLKVGITRESQIPTRWIDQGAVQALPIGKLDTRYHVGLMEVVIKNHIADKTDWRKMLKNEVMHVDLMEARDEIFEKCADEFEQLADQIGSESLSLVHNAREVCIEYPVLQYPNKVKALNFDKKPDVSGQLLGIKGQYLIFDSGVLNVRKFAGYEVNIVAG